MLLKCVQLNGDLKNLVNVFIHHNYNAFVAKTRVRLRFKDYLLICMDFIKLILRCILAILQYCVTVILRNIFFGCSIVDTEPIPGKTVTIPSATL